jgi:hypothetical protein
MTGRRFFALILLAVHLLVFVVGGVLLGETPARAAGPRDGATATVSVGIARDVPSAASSSDSRLDRATRMRTRSDRGQRASGGLPPILFVPNASPSIAPPSAAAVCDAPTGACTKRAVPSVVNGPRGPPQAR